MRFGFVSAIVFYNLVAVRKILRIFFRFFHKRNREKTDDSENDYRCKKKSVRHFILIRREGFGARLPELLVLGRDAEP